MSKFKRLSVIFLSLIIITIILTVCSIVYSSGETMYFSIETLMHRNTPNLGYAIGNPNDGGEKIWNIVKRTGPNTEDILPGDYYCLKAGVGFTDEGKNITYDVFLDLKDEKNSIIAQNSVLANLLNGTIETDSGTVGRYEALLALFDLLYLPGSSDASYKEELQQNVIEYASQYDSNHSSYIGLLYEIPLTDDDIVAAQQAAIWYFTNYEDRSFDKTENVGWLNFTTSKNGSYTSFLSGYGEQGMSRGNGAEALYNYLVATAKENAKYYSIGDTPLPVSLSTTTLNYEDIEDNYVLGPIHFNENSKIDYNITLNINNGSSSISDYRLLDSRKVDVTSSKGIKDLVGEDFYISIPKSLVSDYTSNIELSFNTTYETTDTIVAAVSGDGGENEQPIGIPKKQEESVQASLNVTIENKEFDLSLRKYITKVNDVELSSENSRVPNIDKTSLVSGTTATYKHKKDPVLVRIGDKVTYKITVYNEGEVAGYVNKIVDQLPRGLTYSKILTSGYIGSYDEENNILTITRDSSNDDKLNAYNGNDLDSTTIEIECKVNTNEDGKVLTNIAYIAEEEKEDGTVITNQEGEDRDSVPSIKPVGNQDSIDNYTGNGNITDLTDKDYYYKGQEDDDDFEKLIVEAKEGNYSLQIEKVDSNDNSVKLANVQFLVNINGETKTLNTGVDGLTSIETVNITDINNVDKIEITEINTPEGYKVLNEEILLEVVKEETETGYEVQKVNFTNTEKTSVTFESNIIKVVIKNEKKTGSYDLQLLKTDNETGSSLNGAEFKITLPNGSTETKITEANGILEINNINIEEAGTDYITIEETKAPEGYNKLFNKIELEITKQENSDSYIISNVEFGENEGSGLGSGEVKLEYSSNLIKLIVPNVKKEGGYNLQLIKIDDENGKPLSGAEFKVTLPNGSVVTQETNENGILDLGKIEINQIGTDVIKIEELNAPTGYNKIVNSFDLEVTKIEENGMYKVSDIKLNNAQGSSLAEGTLSVNREGNLITITVPNVKKEGSYNLQIEKVDRNNNSVKLEGAEFSVSVNNSVIGNVISGADGLTDIKTIDIQNLNNDTIEITETKAPEGYNSLIGTIRLEVVKEEAENGYSVSSINFENTENVTASLEGNTIKVVIENKKKEFDLSLRKYITKVNDVELSSENSRVPNIDKTSLVSGTTATYKHKKDPVLVRIGDKVTYKITVYNEGEVAGYVNKIVDQLPRGLTYSKILTSGYIGSYDEENNILTITRDSSNDDKLNAYNGNDLDSTTIEIECKVNTNEDGKVLTNIAYIAEEEKEDGTVITNQEGEDRDSVPSIKPVGNQDSIDNYTGNGNITDLTDKDYYYKGQEDDDDFEKLIVEAKTGNYNLQIEKVDSNDNSIKLQNAEFSVKVNGTSLGNKTTGEDGLTELINIDITDVNTIDTVEITETKAPEGYNSLIDIIKLEVTKEENENGYQVKGLNVVNTENVEATLENGTIKIIIKNKRKEFDLSLRKYITKVNDTEYQREPQVDLTNLKETTGTTAIYNHPKTPVAVKVNDLVTYTIRVYNEGEISGYVNEVTDYLPEKLEFVSDNEINKQYGWVVSSDGRTVTTDYLSREKDENGSNLLKAFDGENLDYRDLQIVCRVKETAEGGEKLTNIAEITKDYNEYNIEDKDSKPEDLNYPNEEDLPNYKDDEINKEYVPGQEDDDDFEKIIVQEVTGNYKLQIEKVDSNDNNIKLQNAIFSIKVNGNSLGNVTTREDGLTNIQTIDIADVSSSDTIEIEEVGVPQGYRSLIGKITLGVVKEDLGTNYQAKEINFENNENVNATLENGIIKIVVKNVKKEGDYNLQIEKVDSNDNSIKLENAEFSVKVNDTSFGNKLTDKDGLTELMNIDITDVNTIDTIEITETKAPEGYNKLIDTIKLEVTKEENENGYQVKGLNVVNTENIEATLENGLIKVIVRNDKIQEFDVSLRKFITKVNGKEYEREPQVDLTNLIENNGTTAIYNHPKTPISVEVNDVVAYTIRVYNEGEIAGYVNEVTDYLPEELEFVADNEINKQYGWVVSPDGRIVTTDYLSKEKDVDGSNLLKAFDGENLDYRDLQIVCKIKESAETGKNLTNLAEITKEVNENGEDVKDRDSNEDNIKYPTDEELPNYKNEEIGDYIPGQEDDDDFEKVLIKEFDLALRKFITRVEDKDITNRIPEVSYDGEKIEYNHTKEPVQLVSGNTVKYTIRVYNEGEIAGYAKEITDDIPEGLEFLPENETNVEYRWVMYDEEGNVTENVNEAVSVKTDYLSKEQEGEEGENLLQAFDKEIGISEENPDYRDVKIAFKVVEPNESDRILVNSAQISDDSDEDGNEVTDKDSTPDEWIDGEDDQDREYVELLYFDLSLRKWVTQAIVIDKDGQTITETGHQPYDDPEEIVKVELHRKHINDVTVKFRYKIRVTNEGEIAGYAKEVTDYIPEGLRFIAEDNPRWTDEGNNVISTMLLENTLLQPGEYAEVEVVLTWINDENNMGLKVNTAEISEDYNDYDVPDIDSTPDNKEEGEDDIDDAPVMLSVGTGTARTYFTLGLVVLVTIAGGIFVIKKYVL